MSHVQYEHTQTSPLSWILFAVSAGFFAGAWFVPETGLQITLAACGVLVLLLAFCFQTLTVRDEEDELTVAFGPIPLFRRRVIYAEVGRVEKSRTSLLDGWGIHFSPSGGITWNLWGFDCVDIYFQDGRKLRLGTDDPAGLEAFLKQRVNHPISS